MKKLSLNQWCYVFAGIVVVWMGVLTWIRYSWALPLSLPFLAGAVILSYIFRER